ncbi:MAG: dihydrolipoyl dehydrogenase [Clostridium sp.]|nr:dihydrolipoyl dehydrogenase [Clostridium sp.]
MENKFDLGIIGGGPAGYSAAIRASQKGLSVVLFEKDCMGGVCLNKGCIPTKTILHCSDFYKSLKKSDRFGIEIKELSFDYEKIFNRKNDIVQKIQKSLTKLIQSYGVEIITASAQLISADKIEADGNIYQCENIILATGSKPSQIKGLETDGKFVINSNDILNLDKLPDNILVVGSGAIGIEWARIFSAFQKNVTVIELAERLLPVADLEVSKRVERLFKKDKIKFYTDTKIEKIENKNVFLSNNQTLNPDMILCAIGREPVLPDLTELKKNGKYLYVDENFRTNVKNIFAIGDLNGKMQLAHSAVHQALAVVDFITENKPCHFDANKIPSVIYGNPEIAWVGKTEESLQNTEYKVSIFPIAALGKAMADDEIDGFVKVLAVNNKIVGAHVISPEASSLIQQFALMIDNELTTDDILKTVFAHPTYSESVFEAVLGLDKMSLSLPRGL